MTEPAGRHSRHPATQAILKTAFIDHWESLHGYAAKLVGPMGSAEQMIALAFAELIRAIDAGGSIYVQCSGQGGKAYTFAPAWRVKEGKATPEQVLARLEAHPLENWLKGVIRRRSYSEWRKEFQFQDYAASFAPPVIPSKVERAEQADDLRFVQQVMPAVLDNRECRLVMMSAGGEYTDEEIADVLGYPSLEALRVARFRARQRLKAEIRRRDPDLGVRLGFGPP